MGSTQTSLHWIWDTVTFHIFMKCYYYYNGFNDSDPVRNTIPIRSELGS